MPAPSQERLEEARKGLAPRLGRDKVMYLYTQLRMYQGICKQQNCTCIYVAGAQLYGFGADESTCTPWWAATLDYTALAISVSCMNGGLSI